MAAETMMVYAGLFAAFLAVSEIVYLAIRGRAARATIRAGLEDALLSSPAVADSRSSVMNAPFGARILVPSAKGLAGLAYRFGPKGLAEHTRKRLVLGGVADRLDADTFYAIAVGTPILIALFLFMISQVGNLPLFGWLLVPGSAALPKIWLTTKVEGRQKKVRLALADTLDLLTIAVEAGLGFDAAVARVVGAVPGPLSDELYRMLQEVRIGVPRQQALQNLAERTDVSDLDQFITAINQADSFGISVGRILNVQASELRTKRRQLAEERAAKTPVKLMFPLVLCIFPALFVVIVGPAVIRIMDRLFGTAF